jgi:uncharacterized protein (DUF1501 family)
MTRTPPSRRRFLQTLAALSCSGALPLPLARLANARGLGDRVLLVVHLDGGCDGINTVIPHTDAAYFAARPTLAIPSGEMLPISASLGLHPAMTGLKAWYDRGKVAVVNGVGYPDFVLSHFAAEDIYWTASPEDPQQPGGWLGRALDALPALATLSGACLENQPPRSMAASTYTAPAIPDPQRYLFQTPGNAYESAAQLAAAQSIFGQGASGAALFDGLLAADLAALDSVDQVQAAVAAYESPLAYGEDDFSQALKLAGQLIRADLGMRVLTTSLGGFDTHSNQAATMNNLLGQFSDGVDKFMQDAAAGGFADRIAILVWSEFGRRVAENASGGTDHGTAAPMFLIGQGVRGGVYGAYPSLTELDDGNLRMSTDFRSVYATALSDWLGLDPTAIMGRDWAKLPLFA